VRVDDAAIARGALVIGAITVASRVVGLVRTLVFSQVIGATCLGSAYLTAYQVPSLIAELALGGALTSALVPVLARPAALAHVDPAERARVSEISSAVLTWAILILLPVAVAIALAAWPIASLLTPANPQAHCQRGDVLRITASMIEVFSPQVLLYGVAVVFIGLLQSYRRFAGPTAAPIMASLILIASYLAFWGMAHQAPLANTPGAAGLLLSAGTTLSVVALVLVMAVPATRLRLKLRPRLRLPSGVTRRVGGLVAAGMAEFAAADLSAVVVVALANGRGTTGALVLFNYAFLVFNAMYAILAISIVTSAFPALSAADGEEFDRTCAGSTRAVLLMSCLGSAMMAAIALPVARVLARQPDQVPALVAGFLLFAPGLVGAGLTANLARAMLAISRFTLAALALAGSGLVAIVADLVLTGFAPAHLVVAALALGGALGQTVVAVPVVFAIRRLRGRAALRGAWRAGVAGLAAGAAGGAAGVAASAVVDAQGKLLAAGSAAAAACLAASVFLAVAYLLDKPDSSLLMARMRGIRSGQSVPGSRCRFSRW